MSQDNITIGAGQSGLAVREAVNKALVSVYTNFAGATDPATLSPSCAFPYAVWVDTANNLVKRRNAANDAWIVEGVLSASGAVTNSNVNLQAGTVKYTASTTLTADDIGKLIICNSDSAITITLPAAPTANMTMKIFNAGAGTVTISGGTIHSSSGSATSATLDQNASTHISSDGTEFYMV